jgi:hypothetical protein
MKNATILERISELVEEENALRGADSLPEEHAERTFDLTRQLDQCWDLLRQRRALAESGSDPNAASVRPSGVVEGYTG